MLTLLSPAKKLTKKDIKAIPEPTIPDFMPESTVLMKTLKKMSARKIGSLMKISEKLATLNYERYQDWDDEFSLENAHPAALSFDGEVFWGLKAETFKKGDFKFAQNRLRILSGLHGLLKPMDLIKPYRLEMGSKLTVGKTKNLYDFWGDKINKQITAELEALKTNDIINLASNEYFKSVRSKELEANIYTFHFRDLKNDVYKPLFAYVKRARGLMAAYIVKNRIKKVEGCKAFDSKGYVFNADLSEGNDWVFTRDVVEL